MPPHAIENAVIFLFFRPQGSKFVVDQTPAYQIPELRNKPTKREQKNMLTPTKKEDKSLAEVNPKIKKALKARQWSFLLIVGRRTRLAQGRPFHTGQQGCREESGSLDIETASPCPRVCPLPHCLPVRTIWKLRVE